METVSEVKTEEQRTGRRPRILLVDDDPANLLALEAALESLGHELVSANSGFAALRQVLNTDFAAIILDVRMPEIDGFETAALIRSRKRSEHTPILFMTGFSDREHLFRGYELGAVDFLFKPVLPEVLRSKVNVFVEIRKQRDLLEIQAEEISKLNEGLEKEVDLRTAQLRAAIEEAEQARLLANAANEAKSQFLANVTHELRTPLNAIIGYAEMLEEDAEHASSTLVPDIQKIRRAAGYLLQLINDVLDISKIEAGKMDVASAAFDVKEMIDAVVDTATPLIQQNGNRFELSGDEPFGKMTSDLTKVRQCLLNLLSNAAKFTRNGLVSIHCTRTDDTVVFRVADTGPGISREQKTRLFEPFTQVHPGHSASGTGLGLAITRRLCRLLGGRISLESEIGKGSVFTLSLPAVTQPVE